MFEYLYAWLRDISYYLILVTAVTYVLPSNSYRKYIRFFTGLVLILMLMTPVMRLFGVKDSLLGNQLKEFEYMMTEYSSNEDENVMIQNRGIRIEVEDVVIEP